MNKSDLAIAGTRAALAALVLLVAGGSAPALSEERAFTAMGIAETVGMRKLLRFQPLALSPDGELVAYGVAGIPETPIVSTIDVLASGAPALYAGAELRVANTQSGQETLISGEGTNWNAAWSPDGARLAFCSDRDGVARLWVWERSTGVLRRISDVRVHHLSSAGLHWSSDGNRVLLNLISSGGQDTARVANGSSQPTAYPGSTVTTFASPARTPGEPFTLAQEVAHTTADLGRIDLRTGEVDRLLRGENIVSAEFSSDGRYLAYVTRLPDRIPGSLLTLSRLTILDLRRGVSVTPLPRHDIAGYGKYVHWVPGRNELFVQLGGPDGGSALITPRGNMRRLSAGGSPNVGAPYFSADGQFLYRLVGQSIWEVSLRNGQARELYRAQSGMITGIVAASDHRSVVWLRSNELIAIVEGAAKSALVAVDANTGASRTLLEEERHYGGANTALNPLLAGIDQTNEIIYASESPGDPPDLWSLATTGPRRLTTLNPAITGIRYGEQRYITWTGASGLPQDGLLLLPSEYREGERYPLVMVVYPIPAASFSNYFGSYLSSADWGNLQLLATRGYAVLFTGATFVPAGEPAQEIVDAMLPAIDRVIELGVADPERIGVFGESAGGFSTLALITNSTRFRAAVVHAGPSSFLENSYALLNDSGYSHGLALNEGPFMRMPDHAWNARNQYMRNSAWFHLEQVQTPVLLMYGERDDAVSVASGNALYNGLRRLGRHVEYARYADEGHGFSSRPNAIDATQRYIAWFDRFLCPQRQTETRCGAR